MDTTEAVQLARVRRMAARGHARRIRIRAGLSLAEVADGVGVSPTSVYRWEIGERRPRGAPALRYLALLDDLSDKAGAAA